MTEAGGIVTAKPRNTTDPKIEIARRRLETLKLAERLGSVTAACRDARIARATFYNWKRRFHRHGLEGLKDRHPIAKSHPMTTPGAVIARINQLATAHPDYGCNRFEKLLAAEGTHVSAITIQKILNNIGLGTKSMRSKARAEKRQNAERFMKLAADAMMRNAPRVFDSSVSASPLALSLAFAEVTPDFWWKLPKGALQTRFVNG